MYKDLLINTCPHHGFETWRLVSHFYEGLTPKYRQNGGIDVQWNF
jgi:hypothetical protein